MFSVLELLYAAAGCEMFVTFCNNGVKSVVLAIPKDLSLVTHGNPEYPCMFAQP